MVIQGVLRFVTQGIMAQIQILGKEESLLSRILRLKKSQSVSCSDVSNSLGPHGL